MNGGPRGGYGGPNGGPNGGPPGPGRGGPPPSEWASWLVEGGLGC